jgi:hypothetical protein
MEVLYENQWYVQGQWTSTCPREGLPECEIRPSWSDSSATLGLHKNGLEAPLNHRWAGPWAPAVGRGTDGDGWRYAVSWLAFLYPAGGDGFGSSSAVPSAGATVRRRRWTRAFERGAPPLPPPEEAKAAAPAANAPLSPPAVAADAVSVLAALRCSEALPCRSARAFLPPSQASADLAAVATLLPALRRGVAHVARTPPGEQRALVMAALERCARDLLRCLVALAAVARCGGRGGDAAAGAPPAPWPRIALECAALQRAVAEEARQLVRAAGGAGAGAAQPAATVKPRAAAGGGGGGGGGGAPQRPAAAAAVVGAPPPPPQPDPTPAPLKQSLAQLSQAQLLDDEAAEREADISGIAKGVEELADMFKDLAALVEDQGEAVTVIETNTGEAKARAEDGVKHLVVADKHHRDAQPCAVA